YRNVTGVQTCALPISIQTAACGVATLAPAVSAALLKNLAAQRERFEGLCDHVVPVDLTPPEEGFNDPHYGGEKLKATLLHALPRSEERRVGTDRLYRR